MSDKVTIPIVTAVAPYLHVAGGPCGIAHELLAANQIGRLAGELAKSVLQQQDREASPYQAERCCDMAEALYSEFAKRGWLMTLPDPTRLGQETPEPDSGPGPNPFDPYKLGGN